MDEMLHFIYTGKSVNLEKMVPELLAAADKVMAATTCQLISVSIMSATPAYVTVRSREVKGHV